MKIRVAFLMLVALTGCKSQADKDAERIKNLPPIMQWREAKQSGGDYLATVAADGSNVLYKVRSSVPPGAAALLYIFEVGGGEGRTPTFSCTDWRYKGQDQDSYIFSVNDYLANNDIYTTKGRMVAESYEGPVGSDAWASAATLSCSFGKPDDSSEIETSEIRVAKNKGWKPTGFGQHINLITLKDDPNIDAVLINVVP